jgi:hypothetical protein
MGCCRKILRGTGKRQVEVICLNYVVPVRILVVVSIWLDALYAIFHLADLSMIVRFFMLLHVVIAALILNECQRSVRYHALYASRHNIKK